MFRDGGEVVLPPSDLVRFLACPYGTYLSLIDLDNPQEKAAPDERTKLLQRKGLEHEQNVLQRMRDEGHLITEIKSKQDLSQRLEETTNAMEDGEEVVYQGVLRSGRWLGIPDFLKRVETASGVSFYEPLDVKLARSPSVGHVIQLGVYAEILQAVQGKFPDRLKLILGDSTEVVFPSKDFLYYCRNAMRRLEIFIESPPEDIYPERCAQCDRCQWRDMCDDLWEQDDHLCRVADIRRSQIKKLHEAGIETVRTLSELQKGTNVAKLPAQTLNKLISQAALQVSKRDTGRDSYEILPQLDGKGFARLPTPEPGDMFFDIEGDPVYPEGLEYLFGVYFIEDDTPQFKDFWAHDHPSEKTAFQEVMDFMVGRLEKHPTAAIYHYAHYEETALKRLASRYGTREAELDDLLRNRKLVDLYKVVREALRISEPSYSLKNIEHFYMKKREGEVSTAGESIVVYEEWRQTRDNNLLEEIRSYNEDDCRSTNLLREWLLSIRPGDIPWFSQASAALDEEKKERQQEAERIRSEYEARLLEIGSGVGSKIGELTAYLLEFHRREAKPAWWALFDRREKSETDLIDDPECLGGLRIKNDLPPFPVKRSTVYTYSFPPQDFKLTVDDDCLISDTLERAGKIAALNEEDLTVQIKRGNQSGDLPKRLSIIPTGPIDDVVLRRAVYRFADSVISGSRRYKAVEALLNHDLPAVDGHQDNTALIDEKADLIPEVFRVVASLSCSYLFIQGPPGSGKTYTASEVIVDLIKNHKKVGVSSNSHKAINNLLAAVEEKSRSKGVPINGVKKSTSGRSETFFEGSFIKNVTAADSVDQNADLIAGTAWLFAREEFDQVLDYLFIDEAGQVSIANVVGMGLSARNIVLVGDPMQLAQPLQGVHPGESGQSVLEFLLQDRATVPSERGIFLPKTWRMHERVCSFISRAVYDGRLKPEEQNQKQRLLLADNTQTSLKEAGLSFVPVEHYGCSQKSEEEAQETKHIFESLLLQKFRAKDGKIRQMTPENILVVSPYNMQVNHLRSVLPTGARVGTVDKFQGQEAEVVLISMATSSGEDLPRHIEFLYSKNRLNVAISRAKILSVILASPELLNIRCRTIDQLRLVNTLCWARSYSSEN